MDFSPTMIRILHITNNKHFKMTNALKITKTYPNDNNFYRWVCEKVVVSDTLNDKELSCPIYRKRTDIMLAVNKVVNVIDFWENINPLASELFKTHICGDCYIIFEKIKTDAEFNLWCDIIKKDLLNAGANDKTFTF